MIKINDDIYIAPALITEIVVELSISTRYLVLVKTREPDNKLYFGGHFEFADQSDRERARSEARERASEIAAQITEQMQPT